MPYLYYHPNGQMLLVESEELPTLFTSGVLCRNQAHAKQLAKQAHPHEQLERNTFYQLAAGTTCTIEYELWTVSKSCWTFLSESRVEDARKHNKKIRKIVVLS